MAGLGIRIFTDEMVHARLAAAIRQRGYDVESCHEVGRANRHIADPDQLAYATTQVRAILTQNVTDFYALDFAWKSAERRHAGILVYSPHLRFADLLVRLPRFLDMTMPETQDIPCSGSPDRQWEGHEICPIRILRSDEVR